MCACDLLYPVHFYVCIQSCIFSLCLSLFPFPNVHENTFIFIICSSFHLPKCVSVMVMVVVVVVVCVCVCTVCVCQVYVQCAFVRVCAHACVCVSCACGLFFISIISCTCMFLPFFFFNVCIWIDILCIYFYTGCQEFILFFSFFFCLYICMCVLYLFSFFFSVYTLLTSYLIHISYVLNMFGFFFFFYIFCSLCLCIISRIALVPHGRGLDVKRPWV